MMAAPNPPLAAPTMVASAVEMNRALPMPQPPRRTTMSVTPADSPARALKTTMSVNPARRVFLAPMREDTHPAISMNTAVTKK